MGFLKKTNALRISTTSQTAIGISKEINLWEILIQNASSGWVKPLIIGSEKRKWQMKFYILLRPRTAPFLSAWISISIGEFFILNWLHGASNLLGVESPSASQRIPIKFLRPEGSLSCSQESLNQTNLVHNLTPYSYRIYFNNVLPLAQLLSVSATTSSLQLLLL
jgi:hypothetical protein